jgi:class 3 adenylate cyclase/tetratricopeptide (TPR) repeat protein
MTVCASCGQENPDGFRFCGNCAAPLEPQPPARELRKVVTVVFCDLTGSTALGDRTDPEALRATMRGYYDQMRAILERHGGTVEKFVGDAVMAVFGVPVAHEDDALRAVRAAWEMREAVPQLGLAARIGVNTGEVVAGEGETLVTGDAVNVAARLEQAAEPGDVLIGEETRGLVRDAVQVERVEVVAKGKQEPVTAYRLVDVDPEASGVARRLDRPMVGRGRELALLRQAYERSVGERSCHLVTLLGTAGVGKSRLVAEFLQDVDATVLRGRCLDYGDGITLWPVIGVLKQLGAEETIDEITGTVRASELFWIVRSRLEQAAAAGPLVVVFEDIHWAEPMFLDLIDHISDLSRGVPIMLLCVARPELLDDRPGWAGGKLNATTTLLEPLSQDDAARLVESLGGDLDPHVRSRVLEAAGGNPLFVEEMLEFAREDGDVRAPATVHALLQARLDRLPVAQRAVIERGAVEGEVFHRLAVTELSGEAVDGELVGLVRKELIRPERGTDPDDDAYRFRHLLIRDAAYDALPKETRAELHERFARWVEARGGLVELDEIVGYHLEQAALYLRELGRARAELEEAAAARLAAAGEAATSRDDLPAAQNLLRRAIALLRPSSPERDRAVFLLVTAVLWSGGAGADEVDELIAELEASREPIMQMHGRLSRAERWQHAGVPLGLEELRGLADEARSLFESTADDAGLSRVWSLLGHAYWYECRAREALECFERARDHALAGGTTSLRLYGLIVGPLIYGPFMPEEVRSRLSEMRAVDQSRFFEQGALFVEAALARFEGNFDECMAKWREADAILGELGLPMLQHVMRQVAAQCEVARGNLDEGAALYRSVYDGLGELGESGFRSTASIDFGEALYALGDLEAAERLAVDAESMSSSDDLANFAAGRALRAKILADRTDYAAAKKLAQEAIGYAERSDFPLLHGRTYEALAYVLRADGHTEEAAQLIERAVAAHETHGDVVLASRARTLLVEL